jgi:hypothetical protein
MLNCYRQELSKSPRAFRINHPLVITLVQRYLNLARCNNNKKVHLYVQY